ncbi:hypothetical protein K435DRAFT_516958 [Dendrothele bispora CBS 962.96]|uniref:Uncharacterized protein n=1 Tax=Dendrothele bispora (strain CBS 962.96) TaxID=1314807 RepID=A0A4S8MAE0_DENBC|nr:hypothetical protein K435DRAFT_516958 [Dendrothele bispora CBS 962.96]
MVPAARNDLLTNTSDEEKALLEQQLQQPSVGEYYAAQPIQAVYEDRPKRRGRLLRAFCAGVLLFFGLKMLAGGITSRISSYTGGHCHGRPRPTEPENWLGEYDPNEITEPGKFPIPPDMTVDHCTDWPDAGELSGPHGSEALDNPTHGHRHHFQSVWNTFELPVSSDLLFLLSRGPWSAGSVDINQSDEPGDVVLVNVTTYYHHPRLLEHAQVCKLNRKENEVGVGVFSTTPPRRGPHHHIPVRFGINVTLPKGTKDSPLNITSLVTSMGIFPHTLGDLATATRFGNLFLTSAVSGISAKRVVADNMFIKTSAGPIQGIFGAGSSLKLLNANSPIDAHGVSGGDVIVKNANGAITGFFFSKTHLDLTTANALIDVNVTLLNEDDEKPTTVSMKTAHGPIKGNLSLISTGPNHTDPTSNPGGSFKIEASNSLGAITLLTSQAPINSTVSLNAKTALSPVDVQMHPTFEGRFSVKTTLGKSQVTTDEKQEDPDRKGRKRVVDFGKVGGATTGKAYWGDENSLRGEVMVETTLADAKLKL